jgi:hypothetical protein
VVVVVVWWRLPCTPAVLASCWSSMVTDFPPYFIPFFFRRKKLKSRFCLFLPSFIPLVLQRKKLKSRFCLRRASIQRSQAENAGSLHTANFSSPRPFRVHPSPAYDFFRYWELKEGQFLSLYAQPVNVSFLVFSTLFLETCRNSHWVFHWCSGCEWWRRTRCRTEGCSQAIQC